MLKPLALTAALAGSGSEAARPRFQVRYQGKHALQDGDAVPSRALPLGVAAPLSLSSGSGNEADGSIGAGGGWSPAALGVTLPCGAGSDALAVVASTRFRGWLSSAAPALDALSTPPVLFTAADSPGKDVKVDADGCAARLGAAIGADAAGALLQRLGPATVEAASVERRGFFASEAECSPHAALEPAAFARVFEAGAWESSGTSSAVAWGATADGRGCAHVSDTFVGSLGLASALIRASLAGRPAVYRQGLVPLGSVGDPPFTALLVRAAQGAAAAQAEPLLASDAAITADFFLAAAWKGLVEAAGEELVVAGPGLPFLSTSRGQVSNADALTAALLASKELVTGAAGSAARSLRVVVPYAHVGLGDVSVSVPLKELLASASPGAWRVVRREWHFTSSDADWESLASGLAALATRSRADAASASEGSHLFVTQPLKASSDAPDAAAAAALLPRSVRVECPRRLWGSLRGGDGTAASGVQELLFTPLREGQAPWWSEWAQPDTQRGARKAVTAGGQEQAATHPGQALGPGRMAAPRPALNGQPVTATGGVGLPAAHFGSAAAVRDVWLAEEAARVPGGAWEAVIRVAADGSVADVPAGAADGPLPLEALSHVLAAERGYGFVEFTLEQAAE